MTHAKLHRFLLVGLMLALLGLSGWIQQRLNRQRVALGITRGAQLGQTAPPVLVFTTVALGGFRGLIANALWLRAVDLQEQDKYFEKVQLADWITKLQPHFVQVWTMQAWDMAYNISVKFSNPRDRWLWVQRGIELLRDEALRYNPDETLIYRELAWFFQHKMGADLDDAHRYYKSRWAEEMDQVLAGTNYVALINPQTEDELARARLLREKYKMDPEIMREIDDEYGPLEWRLPEAHAVYWATIGFRKSKSKDLMPLRRTLYQPLYLAFQRGRLIVLNTPAGRQFQFGPNLAMIPNANRAYERMAADDAEYRDHIKNAHRNFLKDAIYYLYTHNRRAEAEQWKRYLEKEYPDVLFTDYRQTDKPSVRVADLTLDEYAAARVTEVVGETSNIRVTSAIEGLLVTAYYNLALDLDDEAIGHERLAQVAWDRFQRNTEKQKDRVSLAPFAQLKIDALRLFEQTYSDELVARLRSRLGLPAPVPSTNAAPPAAGGTPQGQ